ncbi:reverse transcriptase domain-containing protein [Tanacetum coccineum]
MDIQPSVGEKGRRHMQNVHRFQEPQLSMSKRLLPPIGDRPEDRGGDGVPVQMLLERIQRVPPNPNVRRRRRKDSILHRSRNLKAYVDDMVIKSKTEKDMIMDIAETFDNLKKKESEPTLRKRRQWPICNPQKEMQSLSGKLAALNRFLSRFTERALPFFDTLKNITKENRDDFRWTEAAEQAFQELKKLIMELPMLTTPKLKEILYLYLASAREAVSGVLMADRGGKQTPIRYVSRTLHEA